MPGITLTPSHAMTLRRAMAGRTQTDVAAAAGIARPNLSAALSGDKRLGQEALGRLCAALGLTLTVRQTVVIR